MASPGGRRDPFEQGQEPAPVPRVQVSLHALSTGVMQKRFLVTGGAGFIGSAVVRHLIQETSHNVLVLDKLTYAGNLDSLASAADDPRFKFLKADITDRSGMRDAIEAFQP